MKAIFLRKIKDSIKIKYDLFVKVFFNEMPSRSGSSARASMSGSYTATVYFDPEADSEEGKDFNISHEELYRVFDLKTDDIDEEIQAIQLLTTPLNDYQLTDLFAFHAFVVVGTRKWWWSFEKNSQNVTIQRSKKYEYVSEKYRRKDRIGSSGEKNGWTVKIVQKTRGQKHCRGTIRDLFFYLYLHGLVEKPYKTLTNNCKHFAARVYNFCAEEPDVTVGPFATLPHLF